MRLVKAVVEGKALSFDHLPLNSHLDMGANILFLAKRWSEKENFGEYLQRMYYLLKQMGQVRKGENDIFAVLERAHQEYPFYDFESEVRLPIEVVRWKVRKLVKQIDRELGWRFGIPTGMIIKRKPGDNLPQRISLAGFCPEKEQLAKTKEKWAEFLGRAKNRTAAYNAQGLSPYEKIFREEIKGEGKWLDTETDDLVLIEGQDL